MAAQCSRHRCAALCARATAGGVSHGTARAVVTLIGNNRSTTSPRPASPSGSPSGITDYFGRRGHFVEELCLGETCVTRDQFADVFGGSQVGAAGAPVSPSEAPSGSSAPSQESADTVSTTTPSATTTPPSASNDNEPADEPVSGDEVGHENDQAQEQEREPEPGPEVNSTTVDQPFAPEVT